ncbi:MAG: hypothetical protein JWM19_980 [Actinomycetia bacterium]|nr:hypothetical protein [Actinomycetes bacterium]
MSTTIQLRRDTAANWTSTNPVLYQGEIGVETDTSKGKIGDGSTAWSSLAYWATGGGLVNNAAARTATATLLPGEETIFSGSTAAQTLTLPAAPPAGILNAVTNAASVAVTMAPGAGAVLSNFGTAGNITIPAGYTFAVVYIGTTWYVQSAGPADFARSGALSIPNGGTGHVTAAAAILALLASGVAMPAYFAPAVVTLTDGSSVALNAALGNDFRWTLSGSSHTLAAPSNPVNGQPISIAIKYTGSFTPLFNSAFDFGAAGQPAWTATSGKTDFAGFRYDLALNGGAGAWAYMGSMLGMTS